MHRGAAKNTPGLDDTQCAAILQRSPPIMMMMTMMMITIPIIIMVCHLMPTFCRLYCANNDLSSLNQINPAHSHNLFSFHPYHHTYAQWYVPASPAHAGQAIHERVFSHLKDGRLSRACQGALAGRTPFPLSRIASAPPPPPPPSPVRRTPHPHWGRFAFYFDRSVLLPFTQLPGDHAGWQLQHTHSTGQHTKERLGFGSHTVNQQASAGKGLERVEWGWSTCLDGEEGGAGE